MADFTIKSGHFTVQVNDGHFSETYEIDAASADDALRQARMMWGKRSGMRAAPSHAAAMAAAHDKEMREAADNTLEAQQRREEQERHDREEQEKRAAAEQAKAKEEAEARTRAEQQRQMAAAAQQQPTQQHAPTAVQPPAADTE
jgi:hypothetical protein